MFNWNKKEKPIQGLIGAGGGVGGGGGAGGGGLGYITASYSGQANVIDNGDYRTIVWTSGGSFNVSAVSNNIINTAADPAMDIAMMGGGGAGGERHCEGAPSGGMVLAYQYQASATNYPISVAGPTGGNSSSTNYTAGQSGSGFGFTAVGGGTNQTNRPNPGNALNFNQYGTATPTGGGDQGGGGSGVGGQGSGMTGGPGRAIPISPGSYGSGGLFGGGGAGAGRGGSSAPGSPGGGGGNPNGNGAAHTGSGGGGGRDHRQTSGAGAGGICIVKYRYQ